MEGYVAPKKRSRRDFSTDGQRPTLQTIADQLGVSRTTVSNAYSRPDQLAPRLRKRIFETANELGYPGPNPVARRLRIGSTGTIGLLFTEELSYAFDDPAAVIFLSGVAESLQAQDVGLLLVPARPSATFDERAIRDAAVDGFLVYSVSDRHPGLDAVLRRRLPTVVIDQPVSTGTAFVGIDDEAAAYAAASHLVAQGHRRFAVLTDRISPRIPDDPVSLRQAPETDYQVARARLAGYRRAIEDVGVDWDSVPVMECFPNAPIVAGQAAAMLLARDPRPTAVLAITDQLAIGVLQEAVNQGVAVPGELSVVGFDDIPAAHATRPALTSVRQPLRDKGRVAAELLSRAGSVDTIERRLLATELVVRASTGPVDKALGSDRGVGRSLRAARSRTAQ
jgi:DNA-binding LacI/PurR family transcriptional regulator